MNNAVLLDEVWKLASPEYAACRESLPVARAVVTHWALFEVIVTAPQLAIVVLPLTKFTVPVAPGLTVAVNVTEEPYEDEEGLGLRLVVDND